ncbi:MAG TPA: glutathione peroxidase [Gammaproteobacteria bacterium]|nr:glutathione peroxidase [Gammaproteobacteria bacterium]|tara:strand:- start:6808 stop:7473 length:666 start_codon:yes stop_codon:yes gene_type:complete
MRLLSLFRQAFSEPFATGSDYRGATRIAVLYHTKPARSKTAVQSLHRWLIVTAALLLAGTVSANPLNVELRKLASDDSVNLSSVYGGKVILAVNTASKCGYTPQFTGLDKLYDEYKAAGFAVLGFPSNDFAGQDPGSEIEIADVCYVDYGVGFPMFEKIHVRGANAHPLYRSLTEATGVSPGWNFHKYLIGKDGQVIEQFPSQVRPESAVLKKAIEQALAK